MRAAPSPKARPMTITATDSHTVVHAPSSRYGLSRYFWNAAQSQPAIARWLRLRQIGALQLQRLARHLGHSVTVEERVVRSVGLHVVHHLEHGLGEILRLGGHGGGGARDAGQRALELALVLVELRHGVHAHHSVDLTRAEGLVRLREGVEGLDVHGLGPGLDLLVVDAPDLS